MFLHLNDITHFTILQTKLHHLKHMSRNYATTCNEQCCPEEQLFSIIGTEKIRR